MEMGFILNFRQCKITWDDAHIPMQNMKAQMWNKSSDLVLICHWTSKNNDSQAVLNKCPKLFDAELGVYPKEKIHLDLNHDAKPHQT